MDLGTQEVNIFGLNLIKFFSLIIRTKNHEYTLLSGFQKYNIYEWSILVILNRRQTCDARESQIFLLICLLSKTQEWKPQHFVNIQVVKSPQLSLEKGCKIQLHLLMQFRTTELPLNKSGSYKSYNCDTSTILQFVLCYIFFIPACVNWKTIFKRGLER